MNFLQIILVVVLFLIGLLLVLIVLIQDDQGDAMGGLFGGSSSSAFGSRSGNVLTKATSFLGFLFLAITLGMVFVFNSPDTTIAPDIDLEPSLEGLEFLEESEVLPEVPLENDAVEPAPEE